MPETNGTTESETNGTEIINEATGPPVKLGDNANGVNLTTVNLDGTKTDDQSATSTTTGPATNGTEAVEEKKMTINDLQGEINDSITKLKTKLTDASGNIDFQKGDIDDICTTLSGLNLLGEFDKELYSSLNKYFDDSYNTIQVDGIDLRVRGSLSQLMYSKIINGKVNNKDWPSEAQREVFKQSLKGPGMFSSMSMGSLFGPSSSNPTAPPATNPAEAESKSGEGEEGKSEEGENMLVSKNKGKDNADATQAEETKGGGKRIIKRKRKFLKKK